MSEGEGGGFGEQACGKQGAMMAAEGPSGGGSGSQPAGMAVPDFLPPAQRVLFMRIQQKQQEEEERARRLAEGGAERDTEGNGEGHRFNMSAKSGDCMS